MNNQISETALELSLSDASDLKNLVILSNRLMSEIESQTIHSSSDLDREIHRYAEEIYKAASNLARQKFVSYETDSIVAEAIISQYQLDLLNLMNKEFDKQSAARQWFRKKSNLTLKHLKKKIAEM